MKLTTEKNLLISKITPALGCVTNKNTVATLEGVLIDCGEDGKCRLTAFDLEKGIKEEFVSDIKEPGCYSIPANRLSQIVRTMPEGLVTIEVNESGVTKISGGSSEFELISLPGADYPSIPEFSGETGFETEQGLLKNLIQKTMFAVAQNDSRPAFNGGFFEIKGNTLRAVGCDGSRLAIRTQTSEIANKAGEGEVETSFIIPLKTLSELVRHLSDGEEKITVMLTKKYAFFHFEEMCFFSRLIEYDYIDYEKFVKKENKIFVRINRERFIDALERASLVTEDRSLGQTKSSVKCEFEGNRLLVSSVSISGRVHDELFTEKTGDDLTINFNCRYLLDALCACDGEYVRLSMQAVSLLISPDEGEDFLYLVLPVRVRE